MQIKHTQHPTLILASRSPRRVEILKQMGLGCETYPADIDESQLVNESPEQYVSRLAHEKAVASFQLLSEELRKLPILGADTIVALSSRILGKPENDDDARSMLNALSGALHHVHTAVALAYKGKIEVVISSTIVEMMTLTNEQIEHYIASGEHRDKAGSYGIQGLAGAWIKKIEGSYTGVMGLPVYETAMLLRKYGIITF